MVSAKPPVWCPIGSDPNFCAYIWLSPHGSKRDGIKVKSLPAKISRPAAVRVDQRLFDLGLAAAGNDDLPAGLDDLVRG